MLMESGEEWRLEVEGEGDWDEGLPEFC